MFLCMVEAGGYAALFYSAGTKAKFIAYSPRVSLDPVCQMEREGVLVHPFLSTHTYPNEGFVIFDPKLVPDMEYVRERVQVAFPRAHCIAVPFMGHGAYYLAEMDVIKNVLRRAVGGVLDADYLLSLDRKKSKIYHNYLCAYLFKAGKVRSAKKIGMRGISIASEKHTKYGDISIYNLLMKKSIAVGDVIFARKIFEKYRREKWFRSRKNKYSEKSFIA